MKNTVEYEMAQLDMDDIMKQMVIYATSILKGIDIKQLEGITPKDMVSDVIMKVLEGTRKWEGANIDNFKLFLFGCLRSDIGHLKKKIGRRDLGLFSINHTNIDIIEQINIE